MIPRRRYSPAQESACLAEFDAGNPRALWQDTARTSQVTTASQSVAVWDDIIFGRNLKQSSVSLRPTYVVNSGYPGVKGDGVDDWLQTDLFSWGATLKHELWIVMSTPTVSGAMGIIAQQTGSGYGVAGATLLWQSNTGVVAYRFSPGAQQTVGGLIANGRFVARLVSDNTVTPPPNQMGAYLSNVRGAINDVQSTASATVGSSTVRAFGSVGIGSFSGTLHHALAFGDVQSTAAATRIYQYLKSRWNAA